MSDYNFLMESRLSPAQLQVVNFLSRTAHAAGLNLYLVGGAVRDLTFGLQAIKDLDFVVEGNPEKILRHLEKVKPSASSPMGSASPVPAAEGQVTRLRYDRRMEAAEIEFISGVRAQVARTRLDVYRHPGRPPQILPGTIFEDLRRRDFAANALAVSLHPHSRGLLLDPTNGVGDIERRELRALHSRSLLDDPSRLYRALRLSLRLGFKPEEKTERWLAAALDGELWRELDPEAQGVELAAILCEANPARVLRSFAERGLLHGLDKKLSRIPYDQFHRIRNLAERLPGFDPFLLYFHCLTRHAGLGQRKRLAQKILRDSELIRLALDLERESERVAKLLRSPKASLASNSYRLLSTAPRPVLLFLLAYFPAAKVQSRLKHFLFKAPHIHERLPRNELESLGAPHGPKFEKVIERVFFEQLDGKLRTPTQLTKALREMAGIKEPPKPVVKLEKSPAPKIERAIPPKAEKLAAQSKPADAAAAKPRALAPERAPAAEPPKQKTKSKKTSKPPAKNQKKAKKRK